MVPLVTLLIPNRHEPQLDETLDRLRPLPARKVIQNDPTGKGIGWALRAGLQQVETPWVIFVMADGSEDLYALKGMIAHIHEQGQYRSAVWGDRWSRGGTTTNYPPAKRKLNRLANRLIDRWQHWNYGDWTDLAKAYRTSLLRQISWSDDFRCAIEIPIRYSQAAPLGLAGISILPMHWTERTQGKSSYTLRQALGCAWTLGKVMLHG
jgi:dolichol-phosphate mannosyltransferase